MDRFYGSGSGGGGGHGHGSGGMENDSDPGPIPDRWLNCPHIANDILAGRFLAFKTPLSARFAPKIEPQYRFQPEMVFAYMKIEKVTHTHTLTCKHIHTQRCTHAQTHIYTVNN